jgi:hypothetical protein
MYDVMLVSNTTYRATLGTRSVRALMLCRIANHEHLAVDVSLEYLYRVQVFVLFFTTTSSSVT